MISHLFPGLVVQHWKGKGRYISSFTFADLLLVSRACSGLLSNDSDFGALNIIFLPLEEIIFGDQYFSNGVHRRHSGFCMDNTLRGFDWLTVFLAIRSTAVLK